VEASPRLGTVSSRAQPDASAEAQGCSSAGFGARGRLGGGDGRFGSLPCFRASLDRARNVFARPRAFFGPLAKLGGYNDAWFNNMLSGEEAKRQVGFGNSLAEEEKSLIGPEQDAAAAAVYRPPSLWGPLLQGAGQLGAAYAGAHAGTNEVGPSWSFLNPYHPFNPAGV
jgi:hypothetical protein